VILRYAVLVAVMAFAAGDWLAVARGRRRLEYVCKPATMLGVLIGAWLGTRGSHDVWQVRFFLPGFALSLAGDVFLMLRKKRFFLPGLIAFLLAHVCYVIGFNPTLPPAPSLLIMVPVVGIGVVLFRGLAQGLRKQGQERMLVPVAIYSLVLSGTLFSAGATFFRPGWGALRALSALIGASLFFASDAMLAWDRFVQSFPRARLWVHVTYHVGQIGLAASLLLVA
jgi:uncharacterized membrane protein YhhN